MYQLLSNCGDCKTCISANIMKICGPMGHVDIDLELESVFPKYFNAWAGS
jgi:hypothetical protein